MTLAQDTLRVGGRSLRHHPLLAWAVTALYLVVYLLAIQNLLVTSRSLPGPLWQAVPDWPSRALKPIAAFSYEPVAALRLGGHVTLLVSPLNIAMGLVLGLLVGLNVAAALQVFRTARVCRRRAFGGLLGALPGFLTGFACCVPTVALVLGAQFTVALIALRSWFFPFALAALVASLAWNVRRLSALLQEASRSTKVAVPETDRRAASSASMYR
ncbi:MAG: hypothetical protein ACRD02_03400 [Acidimicrobiia bacterium]